MTINFNENHSMILSKSASSIDIVAHRLDTLSITPASGKYFTEVEVVSNGLNVTVWDQSETLISTTFVGLPDE